MSQDRENQKRSLMDGSQKVTVQPMGVNDAETHTPVAAQGNPALPTAAVEKNTNNMPSAPPLSQTPELKDDTSFEDETNTVTPKESEGVSLADSLAPVRSAPPLEAKSNVSPDAETTPEGNEPLIDVSSLGLSPDKDAQNEGDTSAEPKPEAHRSTVSDDLSSADLAALATSSVTSLDDARKDDSSSQPIVSHNDLLSDSNSSVTDHLDKMNAPDEDDIDVSSPTANQNIPGTSDDLPQQHQVVVSHHNNHGTSKTIVWVFIIVVLGILVGNVLLDFGIIVIDGIPHTDFL